MFDFAWSELALIAAVALIVIGPKDLPRVLRTAGQWVRKARAIAREFQGSIEDMVREVELDDVKKHVEEATRFNFADEITKTVDPEGELQRSLAEPMLRDPLADVPKPALLPIEAPAEAAPVAPAVVPDKPAVPAPPVAADGSG